MKKNLLAIYVLSLLIGCAGGFQRIAFDISLNQIERPKDIKEQYGEVNTTATESFGKTFLVFDDELLNVMFFFGDTSIGITLKNKSDHSLKINWDNAAWINPFGESKRIIHTGVKLVDKNLPQAPSIVVRNGILRDSITPSENIYYEGDPYYEWRCLSLLHHTDILGVMSMQSELEKAQIYVDKTCGLLIPIEIEGVQNDYLFTFNIGEAFITDRTQIGF